MSVILKRFYILERRVIVKNIFTISLFVIVIVLVGACSLPNDRDSNKTQLEGKESSNTSDPSKLEDSSLETEEESELEREDNQETNDNEEDIEATSDNEETVEENKETSNQTTKKKELKFGDKDFDIEYYLNNNYAIKNTYYTVDTWSNEETGKTEYTVKLNPDTKEFSEEMKSKFQNADQEIYEETEIMFNMARQIMDDLSEASNKVHIDSINWVSYDDDFHVTLVQDYK